MHLLAVLATVLWFHQALCLPSGKVLHICEGEAPGADASLKEDIKLPIDAALGFGEAEVRPGEEDGTGASPEKASLGVPIPCLGAQHARHQHADDDIGLNQ